LSSDDEPLPASQVYLDTLGELYSQRYLNSWEGIIKDGAQLQLLLIEWKVNRPKIFHSYLRIDPACFDNLVTVIHDDEVFHNNSNNTQMPVDEQVAITLYRFGHYRNAASTMKVALWAGIGFGTVSLPNRWLKLCALNDSGIQHYDGHLMEQRQQQKLGWKSHPVQLGVMVG